MEEVKENDVVALLVDLPAEDLRRGEVGTVIEVFETNEHHPAGYMLEFVDDETGEVYGEQVMVEPSQIVKLHRRKREAA